jgi:Chaperone of endosialidase
MPAGWIAAAGSAVSAGESIAGNVAAGKATAQNNANAENLSAAQTQMLGQAESVASQPFQAYTGTLTAPLSGNQQQAVSQASSNAIENPGGADVTAGTNLLASEQPWNAQTAATYMNPYTQDVTNAALANQNKSYLQSLAQLQTGEGSTDSFGNARSAIQEADLTANNTLNTETTTANDNAAAYNSAMQAWQSSTANQTAAANAYTQAGQDVTNMDSQQVANLLQTGNVQQVTAQTNLSNQYAQFMRQQGWSAQQLQSLIQGVGTAKGNTAVSAPVQSNVGNSLLGLGATLAGLSGGASSSPGSIASTSNNIAGQESGIEGAQVQSTLDNYSPSIGSAGTGDIPIAGPSSTPSYYSDYALKKNTEPMYFHGTSKLPVYAYHYKSEDDSEPKWLGYMAQDVERLYPEAVTRGPKGFLMVNYKQIPGGMIRPMRILSEDDWATLDTLGEA